MKAFRGAPPRFGQWLWLLGLVALCSKPSPELYAYTSGVGFRIWGVGIRC